MMYESQDESNKIDLLYESLTSEKNGVKIIVPVKYHDASSFYKKIKEQLSYFENVYFDCEENIKNDFTIKRYTDFQWSSLSQDQYLHICLDNVYYPIDFQKLGIDSICFPVALRFSLSDGIFSIPNRESIKYTKEAKQIILKKINKVAEYFVKAYNETIKETDNILEVFSFYDNYARYIKFSDNSTHWDVKNLSSYTDVKFAEPSLKGIKLLKAKNLYSLKAYFLQEYEQKYAFSNNRFQSQTSKYNKSVQYSWFSGNNVYLFENEIPHIKKQYLRETLNGWCYFIKQERKIPLDTAKITSTGYNNYIKILNLLTHPKSEWRQRIKEFQHVRDLLIKKANIVEDIVVPQDWIDSRKKAKVQTMAIKGTNIRRKKITGEVTVKLSEKLERYVSGKNCKFVSTVVDLKVAHKIKHLTVYGSLEKEELFQSLYNLFNSNTVKFGILSERELKAIKDIDLHNWINIDKFMEGKHKVFKRMVTAYVINQLISSHSSVFSKTLELSSISTYLAKKADILNDYSRKYHINVNSEFMKEVLKVADDANLYDTSVYDVYKEMKMVFEKLAFLDPIFVSMSWRNTEGLIKATKDLFKYYKKRMDWGNYNLPINEEVVQQLEEEEIEQLTV